MVKDLLTSCSTFPFPHAMGADFSLRTNQRHSNEMSRPYSGCIAGRPGASGDVLGATRSFLRTWNLQERSKNASPKRYHTEFRNVLELSQNLICPRKMSGAAKSGDAVFRQHGNGMSRKLVYYETL